MVQNNKAYMDFLETKGYVVSEQDGILTVSFGDVSDREAKNKIMEVNELLGTKGYRKSLGFRWMNKDKEEAVQKTKCEPAKMEEPPVKYEEESPVKYKIEDAGQLTFGF